MQQMVDENGMAIGTPPPEPGYPQQQPMVRPDGTGEPSQQELDQAFPPQQQRQPQPQRPPEPRSTPPAEPSEPRPQTP
jgi:penicillin-binding protein 1A